MTEEIELGIQDIHEIRSSYRNYFYSINAERDREQDLISEASQYVAILLELCQDYVVIATERAYITGLMSGIIKGRGLETYSRDIMSGFVDRKKPVALAPYQDKSNKSLSYLSYTLLILDEFRQNFNQNHLAFRAVPYVNRWQQYKEMDWNAKPTTRDKLREELSSKIGDGRTKVLF